MFKNLLNNIYVLVIFLTPSSTIYYGVIYIFLLVLTKIKFSKRIVILFSLFLSFVININGFFETKDFLVALNIGLLLLLFPFFYKKIYIKIHTLYIIIIIVLISQLSFLFQVEPLMNLFEFIYGDENSEFKFTRFITSALRNGGLYYNPNQASKYLTSLLTLLLVLDYKNRDKLIIAISVLFSVFLTGSRTGLLITLFILLGYTLFINRNKVISFFLIIFGSISILILGKGSRSLELKVKGSADYKFNVIMDYWDKVSLDGGFLNLLFGNFSVNYTKLSQKYNLDSNFNFGFDAEIGFILSSYGLFFCLLYFFYYIYLLKWINRRNFIVLIPFLIWPFTSTILFSIKTSIVYFSILAIVIINSNDNKKQMIKKKI